MIDSIQGFQIEPTNICTLKCDGCARTLFIKQWPQHWKNYSINIDHLMSFLDIDLTDKIITLGGNYGDPIYHPELIELVRNLKSRKSHVSIVTNGSYKKYEWWGELTELLDASDTVVFSIDGTPENFTQYRENADWNSIKIGIDVCVKSQCKTTWKFIPFSFNQHNIDAVREYSESLGIDVFRLEHSDRFVDSSTQYLIPTESLLGQRYHSQLQWQKTQFVSKLSPKCSNNQQHYISADGYYSPCCYLADHRFYYKTQFSKHKKQYSIQTTTLSALLQQKSVTDFYSNLEQQPGCQFNCPG